MNVDSVATWHEGADRHWLLATAKEGDVLHLFDAASGEFVRDIGKAGTGPGEFDRPNGITVIDDLLVVVERDNRRVQVLSLPDFRPLAVFGADQLIKPYGIYVRPLGDDRFEFYVTDNYET
ncbi:MAG TPA: 6-bladed beta-propeller, partial [Steroidobacteraceae bacterium]|nr:6-bladed beta-propeller [Steroidobacteraceae bacterium]